MWAFVDVSDRYRGQFVLSSGDPFFLCNSGLEGRVTDDLHIINQDMAFSICNELSKRYELKASDAAVSRMAELSNQSEPETPSFTYPSDDFSLRMFQRRAIHSMSREDNVMLQMSPGTGKTVTSIFMACQRFDEGRCGKIVVWCPAPLIYDWVREAERFTGLKVGTPKRSWSPAKRREWYESDDSDIWVLNYERVRTVDVEPIEKRLRGSKPLFLFDEVQKVKNRASTVHKELAKLCRHVGATGKIAMTATPIVTGPEDFYNEFRILEPGIFGRVVDFEHLFTECDGEKDMFGNYIGYKNLAYMHVMTGSQVFSASKSQPEIAVEFPRKHELLLPYQMSPREGKLYDEIASYGKSLDRDERCGSLFFLTYTRLCNMPEVLLQVVADPNDRSPYGRQLAVICEICHDYASILQKSAHSAKLELATEKVEEIVGSGEKLIVFAQHTNNCLFPLAEHWRAFAPLIYVGEGMSLQQKEEVKRAFKEDPSKRLLLMSDAGQVGLNFQECRYLMHYQTPISHAAYEQRSDRIHRISSEHESVSIFRMMGNGTVEERIEETMAGRRAISCEMGFDGEYESYGAMTREDADYLCGF